MDAVAPRPGGCCLGSRSGAEPGQKLDLNSPCCMDTQGSLNPSGLSSQVGDSDLEKPLPSPSSSGRSSHSPPSPCPHTLGGK